jgi:hypothetical protein
MPSPSIWSPIGSNGRARARAVTRRRARELGVAVVGLAAAVWLSGHARASIMVALELPDLVQQADHIAVVDVRSVRSEWDAKHERIYSTIELGVVDLWKSSPPSPAGGAGATTPTAAPTTLTIVQPGGTVGDISMVVMGMSRFVPGTRSLVFLRGQAAHAQVVGMSQGLHPLTFESTTRRWTVAPSALGDVKLVPRAAAPVRPPTTTQISSGSRLPASALPPAATAISPVSPRAPVALDVMKAEVLRLMSAATP